MGGQLPQLTRENPAGVGSRNRIRSPFASLRHPLTARTTYGNNRLGDARPTLQFSCSAPNVGNHVCKRCHAVVLHGSSHTVTPWRYLKTTSSVEPNRGHKFLLHVGIVVRIVSWAMRGRLLCMFESSTATWCRHRLWCTPGYQPTLHTPGWRGLLWMSKHRHIHNVEHALTALAFCCGWS